MQGIYCIKHTASGRCYVGSAVDIARRLSHHCAMLNAGRHHSPALQAAWRAHGIDAFEIFVIEEVAEAAQLVVREQHWIDTLQAYGHGYNGKAIATSSLGYRHSDEARAKMSAAKRGKPSGRKGMVLPAHVFEALQRGRRAALERRERRIA